MTASTTNTASTMKSLRRHMREEEPEWLVWALVAVMLIVGWGVGTIVVQRTDTAALDTLSLRYPAAWVSMAGEDPYELLHVGEPFETSSFPASASVRQMPVTEVSTTAQTLGDLALKWGNKRIDELTGYKVLSVEPAEVQGQEAVAIQYVYVAEPPMGGPDSMPVVARATDILMRQGDTLTITTFSAEAAAFDGQATTWGRILASLKLK